VIDRYNSFSRISKPRDSQKKSDPASRTGKGISESADILNKGEKTMDVSVGDTIPVILQDSDSRRRSVKRAPGRDRRRDRRDRRDGARKSVVVRLSGKSKPRGTEKPENRKLTY
jgi:hypothetical protein